MCFLWLAGAPCAAAVLLSYLAYEFFGSAERTLVLRAAHSLACAAGTAAPGLAFAALLPSGECALAFCVLAWQEGRCLAPAVELFLLLQAFLAPVQRWIALGRLCIAPSATLCLLIQGVATA